MYRNVDDGRLVGSQQREHFTLHEHDRCPSTPEGRTLVHATTLPVSYRPVAQRASGAEPAEDVDAEALYAENCAACHGGDGEGDAAPALGDFGQGQIAAEIQIEHEDVEGYDVSLGDEEADAVTRYAAEEL